MDNLVLEYMPIVAVVITAISSIAGMVFVAYKNNQHMSELFDKVLTDPRLEKHMDNIYNAIPGEQHRAAINDMRDVAEGALVRVAEIAQTLAYFVASIDGEYSEYDIAEIEGVLNEEDNGL